VIAGFAEAMFGTGLSWAAAVSLAWSILFAPEVWLIAAGVAWLRGHRDLPEIDTKLSAYLILFNGIFVVCLRAVVPVLVTGLTLLGYAVILHRQRRTHVVHRLGTDPGPSPSDPPQGPTRKPPR